MDLDLSTHSSGDRAVITVAGEVDLESANDLGEHALEALRSVSPHLVLDLAGVTFMDSTGLKVLMTIQRRTALAGGSLALVGVSRTVHRLLSLTGLDQTFAVHESVAEAVAAAPSTPSTPSTTATAPSGPTG